MNIALFVAGYKQAIISPLCNDCNVHKSTRTIMTLYIPVLMLLACTDDGDNIQCFAGQLSRRNRQQTAGDVTV